MAPLSQSRDKAFSLIISGSIKIDIPYNPKPGFKITFP